MRIKSAKTVSQFPDTELLIVPLRDNLTKQKKKSPLRVLGGLDRSLYASLLGALRDQKFKAKNLATELFKSIRATEPPILAVGWSFGESAFEHLQAYRKLGMLIYETAEKQRAKKIAVICDELELGKENFQMAFLEGLGLGAYKFDHYKSKKGKDEDEKKFELDELCLITAHKIATKTETLAAAFVKATCFARDLINISPRDCTPTFLMKKATEVAKEAKLKIDVLDKSRLSKLGANALLAVAQGSEEPPYLVKLTYKPAKKSKRVIVLVGKGVSFDSGGLSIKPSASMESMKCDMSGAAAVMAVMSILQVLKPRVEVRAYMPLVENMISGQATRPGDIVKSLNGKTIEILNTDAEGRLILADAIALALNDGCETLIDVATLTGACVVALGTDYAGIFSDDDKLCFEIQEAGQQSGERFWRLPLAAEYADLIKSPVADIKNIGGQWGGAITAALFLKEFVKDVRWAHLDIAGPAFADAAKGVLKRGGAGFAVRTLARYLSKY